MIAVNGVAIPEEAIAAEAQHHPAPSRDAALSLAARALVVRELLLQEVRRQGAPPQPAGGRAESAEERLIADLLDREVAPEPADEAECRRLYEAEPDRFTSPPLVEASHILIAADRDDPEAVAAATTKAEALIAHLQRRPEDFAALAAEHSACSSAGAGGDLGQIARGQATPELETFLFALEEGQLCPIPVRTRYGIHVLRAGRRAEGARLPFDAVRQAIADRLDAARWQRAAGRYVGRLAARGTVTGITFGVNE